MRIIRLIGNVALWIGAALGLAAGSIYLADALGWAQPLIVISGSMEPGIHTGDLLIATKASTADLEVGDVVSLPSDLTHKLVTHRITQIEPTDAGWKIYMKGDANEFEDIAPYFVGNEVWQPAIQVPHVGFVVSKLMEPSVALPIVIALGALLGMSLLDGGKRPDDDEPDDDDDTNDRADHDPTDELDTYEFADDPRQIRMPFPSVAGNLLLDTAFVDRSLSDRDALAEIDEALAALGVQIEVGADPEADFWNDTTQLDRDGMDRVLLDSVPSG